MSNKAQSRKAGKRILSMLMAVVMVLSIFPVSAALAEEAPVVGWGEGQTGSFEDAGWEITGADYTISETGRLTFEMKGSTDGNKDHHPQLVNMTLNVDASKYKKLEITYINTTDNTGAQLYFLEQKDISGGFQGGDRGIGFAVEAGSEEVKVATVAVGERASWTGTIGAIRVNPVNTDAATGLTGKFEIISMKFVGEEAPEESVTAWGEGQAGSFKDAGWEITGTDYTISETGRLTFEMKGSMDGNKDHHPQLVNMTLNVDASKYKKLEITYINTTDNTGAQLYFLEQKDISGGFQGGDRGIGFAVEAGSEEVKVATVAVGERASWTGTIGAIRFNPVNTDAATGLTGKFEIISMKFVGEEAETPVADAIAWGKGQEATLKDWRVEDATAQYEADGSVTLMITGPDTKLIHENLNIDAGTYKSLKLTYVNDTSCKTGEAYFIPASQGNNGFQPGTTVTYEVAADGKEHTLYIPFADNGNWNGTITGVRIDPVKDLDSGSFQVISMEFVENAAPELEAPCEWDWDADGDFLGWTYNGVVVNPEVEDSYLILPIVGEDPNLNSPKVSFSAELYPTMEIVYKNETDNTDSEIFWNNGTGINQACATTFRVENDGEWHTLRVNLSNHENWNGKIQGLRYDPIRSGEGTFTIDSIKFIKTSVCDGAIATEYEWRVDNDTEGWKAERCAVTIKDGRAVLTLDGQNDPIFSVEKDVNVDAENFRTLELTYKNNTNQTNAEFYWGDANGNWVAADGVHVKGFTTVNDGQWHTLRIPLSDVSNWNGTVTKLRIDPNGDGGTGTFELDRVAVLYDGEGETGRYELENGYFSISGAKGMIDKIAFDETGNGNYSEDLISGLVYMKMDADDVPYDAYSDAATAVVEGNTLTISNIRFGTPEMIGKWTITLDGSKMSNRFELDTQGEQVTLKNAGYVMDMLWDNNTDAVKGEEGKPGSLKVPFSKMVSASDRYHNVYAFKYMPETEDISTLGLEGEWIDWEGTNGFDFNLRFEADTEFVSPVCSIDKLRYLFRQPDVGQVELDGSEIFTRTLDITVSESKDITPEHFAKYESEGNELVAQALNEIMWELGYSREPASGQMDWAEWTSLTRAWRQDHYYQEDKNQLTNVQQITEDNYEDGDPGIGYIYTWSTSKGWPFPTNRDSNHYLTSTANYLNAVYNFYSYNEDEAFLDANIQKMRLGMDYLLTQFSDEYGVFLIDHPDHDGVADLSDNEGSLTDESRMRDAVGSNYWDVTPYGYLSAYDNIYCYLALVRTAELEEKLGNTARSKELNQYAETLKTSYNELFWKNDHYIQTIDAEGKEHDYGAVYLNLEAINYGLASEEQAAAIMNYLDTTETSSGEADVFSRFAFSPRATMFDNQNWYVYQYGNPGEYGVKQLQNGGGNMYTMYYELMCWIKTGNSDRAYERIEEMAEFFNTHNHLQGNKDIEGVGKAQHFGEGIVGIWGEFPESGLVPVAVKDGFMGIQANLSALEITPNMPTQMPEVSLDSVDYNGLSLRITTSNDSVTIEALKNESGCEWEINGELVETDANGLFTRTIAISKGDTVVLAKADKADIEDLKPAYNPTVSSVKEAHVCPSAGFTDVDMSQYYHEAVDWAVTNNITQGTSASTFSPDASCTRVQMVTFLWRAAGSPVVNYAVRFTDVDEGAYYAEAVRWAVSEGITKGTSDTTFSPDAAVTRGQVVTFLYRYEQTQGGGMQDTWMFQNPFTDVDPESYYGEAVMWSVANNVTHGTSDTTFSPENDCTRAQIVTFLYRSFSK